MESLEGFASIWEYMLEERLGWCESMDGEKVGLMVLGSILRYLLGKSVPGWGAGGCVGRCFFRN